MPVSVALQLRRLRQASSITRPMMADRIGVKPETIVALEMEDKPPSLFLVLQYLDNLSASKRLRTRILGDLIYQRLLAPCRQYDPKALDALGLALLQAINDLDPR